MLHRNMIEINVPHVKPASSLLFVVGLTMAMYLSLFALQKSILSSHIQVSLSIRSSSPADDQDSSSNLINSPLADHSGKERVEFSAAMSSRQAERRTTLINHCLRTQISLHFTKKRANLWAYYSNRYKYSVCDIYKCGSSNWIRFTLIADGYYTIDDYYAKRVAGQEVLDLREKLRFKAYHDQLSAKQKWIDSLKIITVRDPFARIVSAYRNKLCRGAKGFSYVYGNISEHINRSFRKMRQNVTERQMTEDGAATFEDFVNFLLYSKEGTVDDFHWTMYDKICYPCLYEYDYIAKFETFREDKIYLKTILNVTEEHEQTFFPEGNFLTQPTLVEKHFSGIPCKTSTKLYEKYKNDFEAFGYERPKWLC